MKPKIITLPEFTLVGAEARFIGALSPDADSLVVIPALWSAVMARRKEIGKVLDEYSYGAARKLPENERDRVGEFAYVAGFSVAAKAKVPAGMARWVIPEHTYALFTHRGPLSRLSQTISYIYRVWMPRSVYEPADGPGIERYDERFIPDSETSETDFLAPVRPK